MPFLKLGMALNGHSCGLGLRGFIQPKLSGCSGCLFWFCGGIAVGLEVKEDVLAASSNCWTFWCICMHPPARGQGWWDSRGCSYEVSQHPEDCPQRNTEPAALPFGPRSSAGSGTSRVCWVVLGLQERILIPKIYLEQGSASALSDCPGGGRNNLHFPMLPVVK